MPRARATNSMSARRLASSSKSLTGKEPRSGPVTRDLDVRRRHLSGNFLQQTLELDGRPTVDLLLDLEVRPGQGLLQERLGADEERVRVEDRDRRRIEPGRQAELLEDLQLALGMDGDSALVALLATDLALHVDALLRGLDEPTEDRGIDGSAEVVNVCNPHVFPAARHEAIEELAAPERVDEVAVTGRVLAGLSVVAAEQLALGGEA